jgi:succinate dehydrogenase hydrophobic anchor subunit
MQPPIYKRLLVGAGWFAIAEVLLFLVIVSLFAALWSNGEAAAICLEEYPDGQADVFDMGCFSSQWFRALYALIAFLALAGLVSCLRAILRKPRRRTADDGVSAFMPPPPPRMIFLRVLAGALCCALLPVSVLFFLSALAAWADSQHVCPFGNQCSDAQAVMWLGAAVGVLTLGLFIVLLRFWLTKPASTIKQD